MPVRVRRDVVIVFVGVRENMGVKDSVMAVNICVPVGVGMSLPQRVNHSKC